MELDQFTECVLGISAIAMIMFTRYYCKKKEYEQLESTWQRLRCEKERI